jgi:hypothetical protein
VAPDLNAEFRTFSSFLDLCADNPSAAAELIAAAGIDRTTSIYLVDRFGREIRRLQIDLRQERERRIQAIRHSLERELLESGLETVVSDTQLSDLIERLVPGTSPPATLALLAGPAPAPDVAPITVQINQQFITAAESTIIQNVAGTINLGPRAKQLLELVEQFGGQQSTELEAAVHELEDSGAPAVARAKAQRRLKQFLSQLGGIAHDVVIDLLEKYLESKGL